MNKRILIFHYNKVTSYPPVISLIQNLLKNKHQVGLISFNSTDLPKSILQNKDFFPINIRFEGSRTPWAILKRKIFFYRKLKKIVNREMRRYDVLWTTTDFSVRVLGNLVLKYKHVMQLMELEKKMPLIGKSSFFSYPLDKYAQNAWKVVVPEINRAYIQKTWWKLKKTPSILPNKPYSLYSNTKRILSKKEQKYFKEKRKVVLYLGFVGSDRNLTEFAKAVKKLGTDKYCLYIVGKVDDNMKEKFKNFLSKNDFVDYLGYYKAPSHLKFLTKAYIGILPYHVDYTHPYLSPLNALYCAPNKIFEYAGFSVPMVGTDVLGLKIPFEEYGIGICATEASSECIAETIKYVDNNYDSMKSNCKRYFDSIDLDSIVKKILSE
ncbi:glycosyltransferase [Limosilactobacillus vaginalis]|uniref:glycosyltransferase n=1 Tax=Limosilactobacillus vaginalis TaxID=1633 RepID=UPI0025A49BD7|nr:glycosyltransferase [Limosilactobacillus vaginalis]MDM8261388.1 glycosyltransferase [Limosilactobacillus vaginalis]